MKIKGSLKVAKILWPEFVEMDGLIFFKFCAPKSVNLSEWFDRTDAEASLNHTHILDWFKNKAKLKKEPWWNSKHPDFKRACQFGKIWAQSVSQKLSKDYPNRRFRVYYTQEDNPIVRFHQVHPNEPNWLDEGNWKNDVKKGKVIVIQVEPSKVTSK